MSPERRAHKAGIAQPMTKRQLLHAALNPSGNSYCPRELVSSHLYHRKAVSPLKSIEFHWAKCDQIRLDVHRPECIACLRAGEKEQRAHILVSVFGS